MRTWSLVLDLLAQGKAAEAADIGAQRLKAFEKATVDGSWLQAQYLEFVPPEQTTLLDRREEAALARERSEVRPRRDERGDAERRTSERKRLADGIPEREWKERRQEGSRQGTRQCESRGVECLQHELTGPGKPWAQLRIELHGWLVDRPSLADLGGKLALAMVQVQGNIRRLTLCLAQKAIPPREGAAFRSSKDLLPVNVGWVRSFRGASWAYDAATVRWVEAVTVALNMLYCNGWREDGGVCLDHPALPSKPQLDLLEFLGLRVQQWLSRGDARLFPGSHAFEESLGNVRLDYQGEVVGARRELECWKVVPCWPKVGQAAVCAVADHLAGPAKEKVLDPTICLKPRSEWPPEPKQSKVYATDIEWRQIVSAAFQRNMFSFVERDEVFVAHGIPVLNGAMGVRKVKVVNGKEKELLRFISILTPINACFMWAAHYFHDRGRRGDSRGQRRF